MATSQAVRLHEGDLVAAIVPPGPEWGPILRRVWESGAALLPVDVRLPTAQARLLVDRARASVVLDAGGAWTRLGSAPAAAAAGLALVMPTSGTAGDPKLAELPRDAVLAAVRRSSLALEADPHEPWLSCLTPAHIGGLLVLLRGVLLGVPVVAQPGFDPGAVARETGCRFVSVVPTMLLRLLEAGTDLSRFHAILVGGAALSPDLRARAEASGARVVQTYGLTESCGGVVYEGRPFAGTRFRIARQTPEVLLSGPTIMRGYRDASSDLVLSADGWLPTGDAGSIDERGLLRVEGRLDDLIVTGGEKVQPEEVEAVLRGHRKVADAAVAPRPDPEWGARVVAFVVPVNPAEPPSLDELRQAVSASLPRFKAPRELILVAQLPRTPEGKIRREALRDSSSPSDHPPRPPSPEE
jgi:O-succinylbenzoic acid--CoA ligase